MKGTYNMSDDRYMLLATAIGHYALAIAIACIFGSDVFSPPDTSMMFVLAGVITLCLVSTILVWIACYPRAAKHIGGLIILIIRFEAVMLALLGLFMTWVSVAFVGAMQHGRYEWDDFLATGWLGILPLALAAMCFFTSRAMRRLSAIG